MNTTELILLIAGALVFTISFLIPTGKKEKKRGGGRGQDTGRRAPGEN